MSRLRIFFLFAALLALATAFAACGDGGNDGSPEAILEDATFEGIESADLDLSLSIVAKGEKGGTVNVSLSGPFQSEGAGRLPQLDLSATANGSLDGKDLDFEGGLVLLPNRAYVSYEGIDYEVDPTTFSFVRSVIEEPQLGEDEDEPAGLTACQEAFGELDVADFGDNLVDDGSAEVGGTSTTRVSGDLDVASAIDSLLEVAQDPACQAAAGQLPPDDRLEEAKDEVESAVETAHVEVDVGDDDIVRRIAGQLSVEPKQTGSGPQSAEVDFELTLTGVNEEQPITVPKRTKPLNDLFLKLGVNPIELLELLESPDALGNLLNEIGGGGDGQSYTECLQKAQSAADIQKCGSLLR